MLSVNKHCSKPFCQDILFRSCMEVRFLIAVTRGSYFSRLRSPFGGLTAPRKRRVKPLAPRVVEEQIGEKLAVRLRYGFVSTNKMTIHSEGF